MANKQTMAVRQRQFRVLQSKVAGASVRQIAEQEGVSSSQIQKDVTRVLGELAKEHVGMADQVRALQMERYNQILLRWYQRALGGDVEAVKIVLQVMDKISAIHGVIPDKSMIQVNNAFVNNEPVTFVIESANNDDTNKIPASATILEATGRDLQP